MRRLADILVTAIAPLAWGTNYVLTTHVLPPDRPLLDSLARSLPIGLLIVAFTRQLPKGDWWWKSAVLAALNFGIFFPLLFVAAYHLPGGIASMIGASAPVFVIGLSWGIYRQRPIAQTIAAAFCVLVGLALLLGPSARGLDLTGVLAAFGATGIMAIATVLLNRWRSPVPPLTLAGWQLAMGGAMLLPFAFFEGPLPHVGAMQIGGYLYLGLVGTALAYACWFRGVERLSPVSSTLIGAINPIVAIALGVAFDGERVSLVQGCGIALALGAIALGQNVRESGKGARSRPALVPRSDRRGRLSMGAAPGLRALLRTDVADKFDDELRHRRKPSGVAVGDVQFLRSVEPVIREREIGARPDAVAAAVRRGRRSDDPSPADRK